MERYREIIPDWPAFTAALDRPQPVVLRTNSRRVTPAALAAHLEQIGFQLAPLNWAPGFFQVTAGPYPIAKTLAHWAGLFYIQAAAAAVPALAVGARPGEKILDLCAAPGGKTVLLADQVGSTGLVVANEPDAARAKALMANLSRLGLLNVVVTRRDGRQFPDGIMFDRVLADVPCTATGTARRSARARAGVSLRQSLRLAGLQQALLERALALTVPGGTVVYATCTFAPEENECVVDRVIGGRGGGAATEGVGDQGAVGTGEGAGSGSGGDGPAPGDGGPTLGGDGPAPGDGGPALGGDGPAPGDGGPARIRPLGVALPAAHPGLAAWDGRTFDPALALTTRIYPHDLDSGGMYVARLVREGPAVAATVAADTGRPKPSPGTRGHRATPASGGPRSSRDKSILAGVPAANDAAVSWLLDRFGLVGDVFAGLTVYTLGKDLWLSSVPALPPYEQITAAGLPLLHTNGTKNKPLAGGMVHYGLAATRNRVDLAKGPLLDLLEGRRVQAAAGGQGVAVQGQLTRGPVILTSCGFVIGAGYYDERGIRSALPQGRAMELRECLRAGLLTLVPAPHRE